MANERERTKDKMEAKRRERKHTQKENTPESSFVRAMRRRRLQAFAPAAPRGSGDVGGALQ